MADMMTIQRMNMGAPTGWIAPIQPLVNPFGGQFGVGELDQVSLGNEVSDQSFFANLAALKQSALAGRAGMAAPPNTFSSPYQASPMLMGSDVDLFNQMRALKQAALAQAAQSGGQKGDGKDDGKGGKTGSTPGGNFNITARGIERDGKKYAVSSISIHEVGNWGSGGSKPKARDVEHYYDSWDSSQSEKTNHFDSPTKPGAYYQVTVTWADGSTKTVDRQMPSSGDYSETIYQSW